MKQRSKWLNALFILFGVINFCYSQNQGQLLEKSLDLYSPFTVTQYSTKNGLPENQVLDIIEGPGDNLIISTANGIVQFNGNEFKPLLNYNEYKENSYYKLHWNDNYKRLFGQELDGTLHLLFPHYQLIEPGAASTFINDSVYCIDYNGVIYGAPISTLKFNQLYETNITDPRTIMFNRGGFLIATPNSVLKFWPQSKRKLKLHDTEVLKFRYNTFNHLVYVVAAHEIYSLRDTVFETLINMRNYKDEPVCSDVAFSDSLETWISTNTGLFKIYPDFIDFFSEDNALPSKTFNVLYNNFENSCLFAGTRDKGLLKLQVKDCFTFEGKNVFTRGASMASIIKTQAGETILVENGGNLYKLNVASVEPYGHVDGYYASLSEIDTTLYVGTWGGGIKLLKNKKLTGRLTAPESLPDNYVHAVFKDSNSNIWVGTDNGIAKGSNSQTIKPYLINQIKGAIITFYELKNKNLCIGGAGHVYILNKNQELILDLNKAKGLGGKEVRSFYEDQEGKLWIGTYDGGLYCYFNKQLTCINKLPNATIDSDAFCLANDNTGYIFITSNHGLWRINEKDLSDFYHHKLDYLIPFYYGEESGILNTEFNGGFQNNYYRSTSGHLFFPSLKGIVMVMPDEPIFKKLKPYFSQMLVNDTLHNQQFNHLKRNTYSVEFNFSCVNYTEKNNVYFQYMLSDGHTQRWSALQKKQNVTFKMLPPGNYTFSVRALNAFNDRSPEICAYSFKIEPYFYETIWFKFITALALIGLVSLFIRVRLKTHRKKAEEKERVKRQLAELELKAVQAQMNPHFIFNSLNSVKYHLSVNDNVKADLYLDYFSKLLRDFLEMSADDFIPLSKEVEILSSYIELEKVRSNPPFDYSIHIYDHLENHLIPTHLLQPLIENAIKHGILHSEHKCNLRIYFYKSGNTIVAVIIDNGIGREKSAEINKSSKHISRGTAMVNDKIRIVKELYNLQITLTIEDNLDGARKPNGTMVQLIIPIKYDTNDNS